MNPILIILRCLVSIVFGVLIGIWPVLPFIISIIIITIVRQPINIYKTFKIALTTVVLKNDLRVLVMLLLPIAHGLFFILAPCLAFIAAFFGSIGWTTGAFYRKGFKGETFEVYKRTPKLIREYWRVHSNFSEEICGRYDHHSGIPHAWGGRRYGLPVGPWQTIIGLFIAFYAMTVVSIGTLLHNTIKLIPVIIYGLHQYIKAYFKMSCNKILGFLPFFILGFAVGAALIPIGFVLSIIAATLYALHCPWVAIRNNSIKYGLVEALNILKIIDKGSVDMTHSKFQLMYWWTKLTFRRRDQPGYNGSKCTDPNVLTPAKQAGLYWDYYCTECIETVTNLWEKKWIDIDDIMCASSNVILSIPAITVLNILARSCVDEKNLDKKITGKNVDKLKKTDILYSNGTKCTDATRPMKDGVTAVLWPKVYDIKMVLWKNKKLMCTPENVELLTAIICDNGDTTEKSLTEFLQKNKNEGKLQSLNNEVKSRLIDLSLNMSRVRPFTQRIPSVFGFDYTGVNASVSESPESIGLPESVYGGNGSLRRNSSQLNSAVDYGLNPENVEDELTQDELAQILLNGDHITSTDSVVASS